MRCIFQEQTGRITGLEGKPISKAYAWTFAECKENEIIVLWLQFRKESAWYKIFVDSIAANVQIHDDGGPYAARPSSHWVDQLASETEIIDFMPWFSGRTATQVYAVSGEPSNAAQAIVIHLSDKTTIRLMNNEDEIGIIERVDA